MHRPQVFSAFIAFAVALSAASASFAQAPKARKLADGVLITIPVKENPRDTISLPRPFPGLKTTAYDPKTIAKDATLHGQAFRVIMYRENVWEYEFSFIGLRQAKLRVPTSEGRSVIKNVWYMVYRIRDTGKTMTYKKVKQNPEFDHIKYDLEKGKALEKKRFMPRFTLQGSLADGKGGYKTLKYSDQLNLALSAQIRKLEDPNQRLLDTYEMSKAKIPLAKNEDDPGVWGVAIWEDVNPEIDFVSVFVHGLSNAFRLRSDVNAPTKRKILQLNFWRPGDTVAEKRDQVVFGIPLVDDPTEQAVITRRYQLPGPLITGYEINQLAKREVLVVEADAKVNLTNFKSSITPILDRGNMAPEIRKAFADSGIELGANVALKTVITGRKWTFEDGGKQYVIRLEPQYWEPDFGKIRFIKPLDHLWIYR